MTRREPWRVPSVGLRAFVGRASDVALAGCGAIAVISSLGVISRLCDQVNNAAPLWTVGGIAAAVGSITYGRNRPTSTFALFAMVAIAGGFAVVPDMVAKPAHASTRTLRIVSFNAFKNNRHPERAGAWLKDSGADVLVMTEITPKLRAMIAGVYPYHVSCLPGDVTGDHCSTAIYSKTPFLRQGGLARGGDPEKRTALSAAWATVDTPDGPTTILGIHLDHPWPMGGTHDEMVPIAEFLSQRTPGPLVIAGDTNRVPWTHALRMLDRTAGIPRLTHGLATWPTGWRTGPVMPIDHVYASEGIGVHTLETGPELGSDHLPVVVELGRADH